MFTINLFSLLSVYVLLHFLPRNCYYCTRYDNDDDDNSDNYGDNSEEDMDDNVIRCPHLKSRTAAVEKVQRRSTRLVKEGCHIHYEDQLTYLYLPTLKMRRMRGGLNNYYYYKIM